VKFYSVLPALLSLLWVVLSGPAQAISVNLPAPSVVISGGKSASGITTAVSKELRNAVSAAQAAVTNGQWQRCIDVLATVDSARIRTTFDRFKLAELRAYCAQRSGNTALTSSALQEVLDYPEFLGDAYAQRVEIFAQIRFLAGDFANAEKFSRQSLLAGRTDDENYLVLVDSLINLERFSETRDILRGWIDFRSSTKSELSQVLLEKRLYACAQLGDSTCTREVLEILAAFYPSERVWRSLISAILDGAFRADVPRIARLAHEFAIGLEPSDYTFVGASLIDAGYSQEALQFLELAVEKRFLREARYVEAARKLIVRAKTQSELELKTFGRREASAARELTGQADARIARELLFMGEPERAIEAIRRSLRKGLSVGLEDAQVTLGIAHLRVGDTLAATEAFGRIPEERGLQSSLRRSWLLASQVRSSNPLTGYPAYLAAGVGLGAIPAVGDSVADIKPAVMTPPSPAETKPPVVVAEVKPAPAPVPPVIVAEVKPPPAPIPSVVADTKPAAVAEAKPLVVTPPTSVETKPPVVVAEVKPAPAPASPMVVAEIKPAPIPSVVADTKPAAVAEAKPLVVTPPSSAETKPPVVVAEVKPAPAPALPVVVAEVMPAPASAPPVVVAEIKPAPIPSVVADTKPAAVAEAKPLVVTPPSSAETKPPVVVAEVKPAPAPASPVVITEVKPIIDIEKIQLAEAAAAARVRERELKQRLQQEIARREDETRRLLAAVEAAAKRQKELEDKLRSDTPTNVNAVSVGVQQTAERPQRRFALAIGNNQYQNVPILEKAVNDAVAVADGLKQMGYETTVLIDATQRQINSAVNRFARDIAEGGQGVFFFAGHGLQINNQNFLLPVDFETPNTELDVLDQGVSLQVVQDKLTEARAKFTLLILDACRDNPFPRRYLRSAVATRGLAQASSADGQMIVFSAGANQKALDTLGSDDPNPNGVFTRELLPWFDRDDVSIRSAILEVRRSVNAKARSVNHQQTPAVYDQVLGDFYFKR
jgi:hypothetical protein